MRAENTAFGGYLKALRLRRGFKSQRQLAVKAGVDNSTISRAERGEIIPTPEILRKLAIALRVPHSELMRAAGHLNNEEGGDIQGAASRAATRPDGLPEPLSPEEIEILKKIIAKYE
ncbi:MAG: helix-turn-helix domain-containing protein [Betaproteobacteria bacterium]